MKHCLRTGSKLPDGMSKDISAQTGKSTSLDGYPGISPLSAGTTAAEFLIDGDRSGNAASLSGAAAMGR